MKTKSRLVRCCQVSWKWFLLYVQSDIRANFSNPFCRFRSRSSFTYFGRNRTCYLWATLATFFVLSALMLMDQSDEPDSDLSRVILDFSENRDATVRISISLHSSSDDAISTDYCSDSARYPEQRDGDLSDSARYPEQRGGDLSDVEAATRKAVLRFRPRRCTKVPASLIGRFSPHLRQMSPHQIAVKFPTIKDGGHSAPQACGNKEKTAILIPYRNRWNNLHTLLPVLIPMLTRQNIDFTIFIIEQISSTRFNKGLMFNAGFLEAMKLREYDCIILHDVDMVPIDDRNLYTCNKTSPLHFSSAVDKFNYTTLYSGLFGGVTGFTTDHFRLVNGFSNMYFGWGAEDDDLRDRALYKNLTLYSKPSSIGAYNMINHGNTNNWKRNSDRFKIYHKRFDRIDIDGLNSARYRVTSVGIFPIYTWLCIDINEQEVIESVPEHLRSDPSITTDDRHWIVPKIPELPE